MPDAIVAGHICLDLMPDLSAVNAEAGDWFRPGTLVNAASAVVTTGGAVANTGLALHRLGFDVSLVGKVSDDFWGDAVVNVMQRANVRLAENLILTPNETTSHTVVMNPPGVDRMFMYCAGTNDTFDGSDLAGIELKGARLVHFGYPPLMAGIYSDGGECLAAFYARAKGMGITTSLDTSQPDTASEAGLLDWCAFLERVLPHVDVFLPSVGELLLMLDRPEFERMDAEGGVSKHVDCELLDSLGRRLVDLGVPVAVIKLGNQGAYLKTTDDADRLRAMGACAPRAAATWLSREMVCPCFDVEVSGTTGSGDAMIAGFLGGLLRGESPEVSMAIGTAVGAFSVECPDGTSGIPPWDGVANRINAGWRRRRVTMAHSGWRPMDDGPILVGPGDVPAAGNVR